MFEVPKAAEAAFGLHARSRPVAASHRQNSCAVLVRRSELSGEKRASSTVSPRLGIQMDWADAFTASSSTFFASADLVPSRFEVALTAQAIPSSGLPSLSMACATAVSASTKPLSVARLALRSEYRVIAP